MAILRLVVAATLLGAGGPAFAARWSAIATGLPASAPAVTALAIDPLATSTLYALTERQAIYKSEDAGATWRPVNGVASVFAFAIAPGSSSTIYAATGHGVVKSKDGGETWNGANIGLEGSY